VMNFNWKFMVPLSIVLVLVQAFLLRVISSLGLAPDPAGDFIASLPQTIILLLGNLAITAVVLNMIRNRGRQERLADEAAARGEMIHAPAGD